MARAPLPSKPTGPIELRSCAAFATIMFNLPIKRNQLIQNYFGARIHNVRIPIPKHQRQCYRSGDGGAGGGGLHFGLHMRMHIISIVQQFPVENSLNRCARLLIALHIYIFVLRAFALTCCWPCRPVSVWCPRVRGIGTWGVFIIMLCVTKAAKGLHSRLLWRHMAGELKAHLFGQCQLCF